MEEPFQCSLIRAVAWVAAAFFLIKPFSCAIIMIDSYNMFHVEHIIFNT